MDRARLQVWAPALLSPNCLDSLKDRQEGAEGRERWEKNKEQHGTQITAWFTLKGSGQGQINEISNQRLYRTRWCDIPARVRGGAAAGAAATQAPWANSETRNCTWYELMKQKEKVVILWYQPGGKMTFCTIVSASTNSATVLCIFSPSNCLYWTPSRRGSLPSFSITHFKSTSKAFKKPPETNKTLQDPEVSKHQANKKTSLLQSTSIMGQYFSTLGAWS